MRPSVRRSASWLPWARTQTEHSGPQPAYGSVTRPELGPRFGLLEALGSGGMGTVYRAYDREVGHEVALKLLHGVSAQDRLRLKEEFRSLSEIAHPNLVDLYELIANEETCFFTMELVRGVDFVEYARKLQQTTGEVFPEALRDAGRQLALALHALHGERKLHRDVKPSNLLVTDTGRVVLLDFGLVAPLSGGRHHSDGVAGTINYMAPEQAFGKELTAAADWYSFGVTLFEALKGELPIVGAPYEMAQKKLDHVPLGLREHGLAIPAELDALLVELLAPLPERRPSAERIIACLGGELSRFSAFPVTSTALRPVVGRESELGRLERVFAETLEGTLTQVELSGASGIGKSTLVREFLRRVTASHPSLVLTSRCHPHETVTFNAIDGLIDDLVRELPNVPGDAIAELGAEHRSALLRVFPALGRCFPASEEPRSFAENPKQARRLALVGLRELLGRLAEVQPVVLWLDDVHWADEDSGFVLRELLRAPALKRLLLILSYRAEDRGTSPALRVLSSEDRGTPSVARVIELGLGPLADGDGTELLLEGLPEGRALEPKAVGDFLRASGGSPFFLSELARYLQNLPPEAPLPERVGLDELLLERTRALPAASRGVLEVFCVAGAPLEHGVALRAAELGEADRGLISALERVSILRTTNPQKRTLDVYHHRIRDDVLGRMDVTRRAARHLALAHALLATVDPNPLAAVEHFEAAHDEAAVRRFIVAAANQAARVLAFERAARLYRRAIELSSPELPAHELYRRLGLALAHAGRGRDAGEAFLKASTLLGENPGGNPEHVVDLKQLAWEQFLATAHYDEGMAAMRAVLTDLDIPFPRSRREALRKATALRVWSMLRGVRLPPAGSAQPSARELKRLDALWAANHRLSMVDFTLTSYASVRLALDSVRLGEPSRMMRALAHEGCASVAAPGDAFKRRALHLLELAGSLLTDTTSVRDRAYVIGAPGIAAWFLCDFRRARETVEASTTLLRPAVPATDFELALGSAWLMITLAALGETRRLFELAQVARDDAEQREDRYVLQLLNLGPPALSWLLEGRARDCIEQADRALSWAPSDYTTQHYEHYVTCVEADLYLGDGANAWRRTLLTWPQHRQNHLLALRFVGDVLLHARARAAVAAAAGGTTVEGDTPAELRRLALKAAAQMERHATAPAQGFAHLARAAVSKQAGDDTRAIELLRRALDAFTRGDMGLYRECTRVRLGELLGGDEGHALVSEAERTLRDGAIVDPRAMTRMIAPGFGA